MGGHGAGRAVVQPNERDALEFSGWTGCVFEADSFPLPSERKRARWEAGVKKKKKKKLGYERGRGVGI